MYSILLIHFVILKFYMVKGKIWNIIAVEL